MRRGSSRQHMQPGKRRKRIVKNPGRRIPAQARDNLGFVFSTLSGARRVFRRHGADPITEAAYQRTATGWLEYGLAVFSLAAGHLARLGFAGACGFTVTPPLAG